MHTPNQETATGVLTGTDPVALKKFGHKGSTDERERALTFRKETAVGAGRHCFHPEKLSSLDIVCYLRLGGSDEERWWF